MEANIISIVRSWFDKSRDWQKDAFVNLWKSKDLEETKKRALKLVCKEYGYTDCPYVSDTKFPEDLDDVTSDDSNIILKSISNIQGVAALKPTKPLEFTKGLNVVYGANGCGKSSYVKVLKKAENPKDDINIFSNIFEKINIPAKATLTFSCDGEDTTTNWSLKNDKNYPIRIYDTKIAHRFLDKSTETIYEPKLLHIFTQLAEISEYISQEVSSEYKTKTSNLKSVPNELSTSDLSKKYSELETLPLIDDFEKCINFTEKDQKQLELIEKAFNYSNPDQTKKKLSQQVEILSQLKSKISTAYSQLDQSNVEDYIHSIEIQIKTRREFENLLKTYREVSSIKEFGSDLWKDMWKSSQKFSDSIEGDSTKDICVLCQQPLSSEAKIRYAKFSEIYASDIEKKQNDAYEILNKKTQKLSELINRNLNVNDTKQILITNMFSDDVVSYIEDVLNKLYIRANWLYNYDPKNVECPKVVCVNEVLNKFDEFTKRIKEQIESIDEFINNSEKQSKDRIELQSKKWFSENQNNVKLKKELIILKNIKAGIKTNNITKAKNALSEKMITEVYVRRFENELNALNPSRSIKVELLSDGKKGRTSHRISIKGAFEKKKTEEVLSEGEYRVVSIAAFLADLNSINKTQAFIFDDPINSLDHNYEDNVAKQLVKLSFERQVIVFTHRLAFAETLKNCMELYLLENPEIKESSKFNYIELRNSPMGEPIYKGDYNKTNAISSLQTIKDESIPKIRKLREDGDYDLADAKLKSCCTIVRVDIEYLIEKLLLNGLVTRYSKNISSLKIRYLKIIESKDVDFIEKMMTKYSYFEHSQPSEKPIELPDLECLEKDVNDLIDWGKNYKKRLNKK